MEAVARDFGTGEPRRMSACVEERSWRNRVRCGVVERGGVLERELLGVPPMGDVKSDGPARGGIWSTGGVGMKWAYCHCAGSVLGCLLEREVATVGGGLGVAKAGERTIEWSSVWAVACDVRRSVWVAADQGSGYGVVCCSSWRRKVSMVVSVWVDWLWE